MSNQDAHSLSDEQIDCAFDYFLLYDRQAQPMDGSLDDPEALRHLLNDKQSDLELAAQIGKSLLDRNRDLDRQLRESEQQMAAAMETINQLQHTLGMKEELLQLWSHHDTREENLPSGDATAAELEDLRSRQRSDFPARSSMLASQEEIDLIHRKLQALEEENAVIRSARAEEQSVTLRECIRKLSDAVAHIKSLSDEQFKRSDALVQQQTQVNALAARSRELENSLNQVGMTNEMLAFKVEELNAVNQSLAKELRDMKDKYDESLALYTQAQATVRKLRDRSRKASLRPTCLVYSPLSKQGTHSVDPAVAIIPGASDFPSDLAEKSTSIAEELSNSSLLEVPHDSHNPPTSPKPSGDLGSRTSQGVVAVRAEQECGEWDEATMDSSGFVSCSEPIEAAHRVPKKIPTTSAPASVTSSHRPAALRNSLQMPISRDLDWGVEDYKEHFLSTAGEEEDKDDDDAVESARVLPEDCIAVVGTQLSAFTTPFRVVRRPKMPEAQMPYVSNPPGLANRRSWVVEQGTPLPPQRSLDDSALSSLGQSLVFGQSVVRPQRLQLVKQFHGSGVLQRWQRLATPSLTSALFETPPSGVASRGSASGSAGDPVNRHPSASIPPPPPHLRPTEAPIRWSSGLDLSQIYPSFANDNKFVPMSSSSFFAPPKPDAAPSWVERGSEVVLGPQHHHETHHQPRQRGHYSLSSNLPCIKLRNRFSSIGEHQGVR
uniref:HAP1 N-terminal domain-containing protein n=2 Tax=Mesocestoides corti TaxID=53468 RepID=A0A5K3EUB3_MESCO